ncbi:hypothetical protein AJ79_09932 [Helicocarpus griseus UAMH5409]|uniref:Uncharacterized protein n=1 Tax=Helicocarpus griseus UAMH5409 TaxID=1447875 RepID=A0A2B7WGJ4_9EURO|nr:hypothetical protein AJ79_09932 [Helicocarpus griseus UAMH5409]
MGGFHAFAEGDDSDSTHSSGGDLHFNGSAPHVDADDAAEGDSSAPQVDGDRNQHGQPTASSAKQPVAKPTPVKAVKIADKVAGVRRRAKQLKWKLWESASAHDSQGWMDGFILLHPDKYVCFRQKLFTQDEILNGNQFLAIRKF